MKLSEFELEVMQLLWADEPASAPELHKKIQQERDVSYSTVKTIVDRLEAKGGIERCAQQGRTIFYRPLIEQEHFAKPMVKRFIERVFSGKSRPLFSHLLADENLSREDIEYLETLLKEKKNNLKGSVKGNQEEK